MRDPLSMIDRAVRDFRSVLPQIGRRELFTVGDAVICEVDGDAVRDTFMGYPNEDDPMGFVLGGHHYRYPWIPEPEIWIVRQSPLRDKVIVGLFHEYPERYVMKRYGMSYEAAHADVADLCEHAARMYLPESVLAVLMEAWRAAA